MPAVGGFTVMSTVEAVLVAPRLSLTISENVSVVAADDRGRGKGGLRHRAARQA